MKFTSTILAFFLSFLSFGQSPEWFELGTTWTYNWNGVADPQQIDYTYEYSVIEVTEHLGQTCSKIEPLESGFGCLVLQPPYYMYHSNDTIYYANDFMDEFQIGYILAEGASWQYSLSFGGETTVFQVSVQETGSVNIDGLEIPSYSLLYIPVSGSGAVSIFPNERTVVSYLGDLDLFIIPFGKDGVCDFETGETLRCYESPTLNYLNPEFTSCTLSNTDIEPLEEAVLYPNPSSGLLQWNTPLESLEVFDALGKCVVRKRQLNNSSSLSVSDLPPGFYTAILEREGQFFSQKLIIQ
jgi:hypothetical protein